MVDEADISSEVEEISRRISLEAALKRQNTGAESLSECEQCGEIIPEPRRRAVAGCRLCIDCARKAEQFTNRMYPQGQS
jgi:phage/conjugal plasmid C-4 type zinc finger TraR family protein